MFFGYNRNVSKYLGNCFRGSGISIIHKNWKVYLPSLIKSFSIPDLITELILRRLSNRGCNIGIALYILRET